jgi:CheY-like chemotaxis protein
MHATPTVLLVDDDESVRSTTAEMLELIGCNVVQFADGRDAIDYVEGGATAHAAIIDFVMPGMKGPAVLGGLRRRRPGLPAIMFSGYAFSDFADLPPDAKILRKPFRLSEAALETVLS